MKLLFVLLVTVSGLVSAYASGSDALKGSGTYGVSGCGLGSLAFGNEPGAIQVLAATLNHTGVQTFGITSGTSNCGGGIFAKEEINTYIQSNSVALENDIVRGQGETLSTLDKMLNCDAHFNELLQKNYRSIFGAGRTGTELSDKIVEMSRSCHAS